MKKLFFATLIGLAAAACSRSPIVELPLTMYDGYGVFTQTGMGGVSPAPTDPNNAWFKTHPQILRLPEGLSDVRSGDIETNIYQSVYQDRLVGNITPEWYADLQKSWNWTPDTLALSKKPVRTKIAFAFGRDEQGVQKFVLDANGNLDLSDDAPFVPVDFAAFYGVTNKDSLLAVHGVRAAVETFVLHRIVPVEVPVFVAHHGAMNMYLANVARHATASYKGRQLAVNSNGFTDLLFANPTVGLAGETFQSGEYIEIGGEVLKILGVDTNLNVLRLERTEVPKSELHSTQTGYAAFPFEGEEFTSHEPLSLESLRGKYVFLDFWATWCGPCIQEFPNLREVYAKTSREQFEIVGIVGASRAEDLAESIASHEIAWPQILSDEICRTYGVHGYPTTLLVDPAGVIMAKDLRGWELETRILELLGQ